MRFEPRTGRSRRDEPRDEPQTFQPGAQRSAQPGAQRSATGPRQAKTRLGNPARRLHVALLAVGIVSSLLGGRLLQLQAVDAPAYASVAQRDRLRTVELPAPRGALLDAKGYPLAASSSVRNVVADQTLVRDPARTAAVLAPLLDLEPAPLQERLTGKRRFVYLAKGVQPETWRHIAGLRLPGIDSEQVADRTYPSGAVAANLIGFVSADGKPLAGLELSLDDTLSGTPGRASYEVDGGGRRMPWGTSERVDALPGRDVALTIDRDIQWRAQRDLAEAVKKAKAASGTVVVMNAGTGDILALAAVPGFDPRNPGKAQPADRGNRAVTEVYEPGSTGKIITAAAALERGLVTPDTVFEVPNRLERGGKAFADSEDHPTLRLTFTGVMAKSSNIGTILASEGLSDEELHGWYRRFGIGSTTGSGLPGESRGILPPPSSWSGTSRYTIAFGQGYAVTALQMASVFATIANDGVRMPPRIVRGVSDESGRLVDTPLPQGERVVRTDTARRVSLMLESVTGEGGTAPMAAIEGYRVAGKTGTANRVDPVTGRYSGYTASFIGYAPADADPAKGKLVVAVTLQDPKNGHYGGALAGPVFRSVSAFALRSTGVPPTGSSRPALRLEAGR